MQTDQTPIVKDLVLVGGGHSHVIVLKKFAMRRMPGVRITLICRDVDTPYSGMLPGFIAGHYGFDDVHIDLGRLCRFAGARFYNDSVCGLDLDAKQVLCECRPPVRYDVLSIDIGSTPDMRALPGDRSNVVPVKPISNFVDRFESLLARVKSSESVTRIAVVGAGAGGTEMALAIQHRLQRELEAMGRPREHLEMSLFGSKAEPMPTHPEKVRSAFADVLKTRRVRFHQNSRVVGISLGALETADGKSHAADEILWVTQAGTQDWMKQAGLAVEDGGFVTVHSTLESTSHKHVFAAGDCASVLEHPREKAGVFAVRQGPTAGRELAPSVARQSAKAVQATGTIPRPDQYRRQVRGDLARGYSRLRWPFDLALERSH